MRIKYDGTRRISNPDGWRDVLYAGWYPWDEADYGFSIILFYREWNWLIDLNKGDK